MSYLLGKMVAMTTRNYQQEVAAALAELLQLKASDEGAPSRAALVAVLRAAEAAHGGAARDLYGFAAGNLAAVPAGHSDSAANWLWTVALDYARRAVTAASCSLAGSTCDDVTARLDAAAPTFAGSTNRSRSVSAAEIHPRSG
jgi:hypothetical protein